MKIGLAVIGFGGMGKWHVSHALGSDAVTLVGVLDIDPARCAEAAAMGLRCFDNLEALLRCEEVQLVTIATPNQLHHPLTIRCLEAGKHVICEKPAALNALELRQMQAAAQKAGRLLCVHHNRRWDKDFRNVREVLTAGRLGPALNIESRICGSRGIPSGWRREKACGGGMLYDWGPHLVDQLLMLMTGDSVAEVRCEMLHVTTTEVDDGFRLSLRFASGARGYAEVTTNSFIPMPRFYVQCAEGTAMIRSWQEPCELVRCTVWDEAALAANGVGAGPTKTMAPRDERTTQRSQIDLPAGDVHDFYRMVCRAMNGEGALPVSAEEALAVTQVLDAAFRSAESGMPIMMNG